MTNKKHNYDWDAMRFDPDEGDIDFAFLWDEAPQGGGWWVYNRYTTEGQAEFARMKRLYAEDMAAKAGPVRTVTKKEIVPGFYGPVIVRKPEHVDCGVRVSVTENHYAKDTAHYLRAAAETLIEIADALDT